MHALLLAVITLGAPALDSPESVAAAVLNENPELAAIAARADALDQAVPGATVWPDPVVGLDYSNMPLTVPIPGEHAMSGIALGVQQRIPGGDKLEARERLARERSKPVSTAVRERANHLVAQALDAYYRLSLTRQLQWITREHVFLVDQLIDVVRVNYEVGRLPQHDLLQLVVLRDRLKDDVDDFDRADQELTARILATTHRPAGGAVKTPKETPLADAPESLEVLAKKSVEANPELLRWIQQAEVERLAADQAEAERPPDFTVKAGYRIRAETDMGDAGDDFITLGVSMPLPWLWNDERWGSKVASHLAQRRALEATRRGRADIIRGDLAAARAEVARARRKTKTYAESLIPAAHSTLDSTFAAYQVARADFASVYQAELLLLELERGLRRARVAAARATVRINQSIGAYAPEVK